MCVYSMISDHYAGKWLGRICKPYKVNPEPYVFPGWPTAIPAVQPLVAKEDLDEIKREVAELKELLKKSRKYDEKTGQPDCGLEDKKKLLRELAERLGVDLGELP